MRENIANMPPNEFVSVYVKMYVYISLEINSCNIFFGDRMKSQGNERPVAKHSDKTFASIHQFQIFHLRERTPYDRN